MNQQVALITGSSRGIGLAAAVQLAQNGFNVALNARSDGPELNDALTTIKSCGVKGYKAPFNVADTSKHATIIEKIEAVLGPITTLINNAGVSVMSRGDILDVSEDSYDLCLDVNARALFFLTQKIAKHWLSSKRNPNLNYSIINVTSANAVAVALPRAEYCTSKAAAAMISKAFAARLGTENISVYDVQPGLIETEMTKVVAAQYQERARKGLCLIPRMGKAEEIGKLITSLATNQIPYTTGQVISADGGMLLPRF